MQRSLGTGLVNSRCSHGPWTARLSLHGPDDQILFQPHERHHHLWTPQRGLHGLRRLIETTKNHRETTHIGHRCLKLGLNRILRHSRLLGRHACVVVTWVLCVSAYRFCVSVRILKDSIQNREKERERLSRTRETEREHRERERETMRERERRRKNIEKRQ